MGIHSKDNQWERIYFGTQISHGVDKLLMLGIKKSKIMTTTGRMAVSLNADILLSWFGKEVNRSGLDTVEDMWLPTTSQLEITRGNIYKMLHNDLSIFNLIIFYINIFY